MVAVSLVVTLLLGEVAARIVFNHSLDFDMEMWKYATKIKVNSDDPSVGHEHRPNRQAVLMGVNVSTNSYGLRDDETTLEKPDNTYRIVIIGDSITMGWGVPQDKIYPALLEELLNQNPPGGFPDDMQYEVINLGVGNYNTVQEVTRLRRVGLQFDPDLILLGYFINDAEPMQHNRPAFLLQNSYLYAFLVSRAQMLSYRNVALLSSEEYYLALYEADQPGWFDTQDALRELSEIGEESGIPVGIFIIPELHDLSENYPFSAIEEQLVEIGSEAGMPVERLYPAFEGYSPEENLWVTPTDAHHNEEAQAMIAESIYDLLSEGWVGP